MAYMITNANILDGTGREPFRGAVRVEANRIAAVIPEADTPDAAGATVINSRGTTLMPGLIESHAHLGLADMSSQDLNRLPIEEQMLITVRNARTMLDCGYTSAFSAASAKPRLDVVLRREIEAGREAGPRLLANGPEITVTGGLGDTNQMHLPHYETPTFSSGRGRARRDPPGVPAAGARGRRPLEAQPLRRHRHVELSLRADSDDRRQGCGRDGGGARGELARRRGLPERGVGHARLAPRHRGHLSR